MPRDTETLYVRLNKDVKEALEKYAEGKGMSITKAAEKLLNNALAVDSLQKALGGSGYRIQATIDVTEI